MPDFHDYNEVPLDEALEYYHNFYNEVKNTSKIKWYISDLEFFIDPRLNDESIKNLFQQTFKIITERKIHNVYRLRIIYTETNPTILTDFQIQELQKFNEYLKTPIAKEYLISSENSFKIFVIVVLIFLAILYIFHVIKITS